MAHSVFHMAVGVGAGSILTLPDLIRAWSGDARLAPPLGRLLLLSYGLGFLAIVPNVIRHLGAPASFVEGWWMNVFVGHRLIDIWERGGLLVGELALATMFVGHYVLILAAILSRYRR